MKQGVVRQISTGRGRKTKEELRIAKRMNKRLREKALRKKREIEAYCKAHTERLEYGFLLYPDTNGRSFILKAPDGYRKWYATREKAKAKLADVIKEYVEWQAYKAKKKGGV